MAIDYDLVIAGGTVQGRRAAALAAREGARVALVEPPGRVDRDLAVSLGLERLARWRGQGGNDGWAVDPSAPGPDWAALQAQIQAATALASASLSLASLATMGVDTIAARGQFEIRPRLALTTADRRLRARGYVLCPPTCPTVPTIPGLAQTPYRTLEDFPHGETLPDQAIILGRSPLAIALAQALARLGRSVTLLSRGDQLLPHEDSDLSLLGEQLLRASGVTVRLGQRPTAITYDGQFRVTLEDGTTLHSAQVILGTAPQPEVENLNLAALGVRPGVAGLAVDDRLRTAHPRVLACGPALGGYWAKATDFQDVPIAVRNALYLPHRQHRAFHRACLLPTVPALGRVGLTASQAQRWFGSEAAVIQVSLGDTLAAHLAGDTTGLCRWVVHRDGRLLGAHIWGACAQDLIPTVAGMMQNDWRIQHWERLPTLPHSHAHLFDQMLAAWQRQRWQPGTWRRDWAENWCNWRRSRG
ncbi:MAG: FAD-dependent oxidoreductase [Leptolyngbya sp.]|nr:FAD-dependent oxidoreductase [Leptolyngbya sp.]